MILVLKMACSYNFRSALNIFLTFCSIKGAKRYKKIIFENNFRSAPRIFFFFFEILHSERNQEVHVTCINGFPEKILIWGKWAILT